MSTLGLVTIGQAPRDDVTPELLAQFTEVPEVVEVGALDGYADAAAVEAEFAPEPDEARYVTRLVDGSSVTVRKRAVHELVGDRLQELESEVDVIGLLCTGSFPEYDTAVPLLEPSELLYAWSVGLAPTTVTVLMPDPAQEAQTADKWGEFDVVPVAVDPYDAEASFETAAGEIPPATDLVVMDCIGYTESMRRTVRDVADAPVLLGRSVLAKTAEEVL